jgi:GNAT superfamily N-acetyltransferase
MNREKTCFLPPAMMEFHESRWSDRTDFVKDYATEIANEVGTGEAGQGLFNLSEAELQKDLARIYGLGLTGRNARMRFVAALQCSDVAEGVLFKSVIVAKPFRGMGLATSLIAFARTRELDRDPRRQHACVVRVYRDGLLNEASASSFCQLGFVPKALRRLELLHDERDGHLVRTAEGDGSIRALALVAFPSSLHLAHAVLKEARR